MQRFLFESIVVISVLLSFPTSAQKTGKAPTNESSPSVSNNEDEFYICPMHADVTSDSPGQCPKCGMTMIRTKRPESAEYEVQLATKPVVVKPGEKFLLTLNVKHPRSGLPVKEFNIVHDKPFHLFIVSQDLSYFSHIHPQQLTDGSFAIETLLPKEGSYHIYCDIFPNGGLPQVVFRSLTTRGFNGDLFSSRATIEPDKVLTKTVDGVRFALTLDPVMPVSGKKLTLKYQLTDEKTGGPVKDLQPYLAAWGHMLILSEDASDFVHSHTTDPIPENVDRSKVTGGPDLSFTALLPRPGCYRVWAQFQRREKVITVEFTIAARQY
jgi:Heavy metal binding domain